MSRFVSLVILGFILTFIGFGCATAPPKPEEPAYMPKFKFSSPESAEPGSADVTFALCSAKYSQQEPWTYYWPFTDFCKNMEYDFNEMLNARGFTIMGPYVSYDEMAFPDKRNSDLVLVPMLEVNVDVSDTKLKENIKIFGDNTYSLQGTAYIGGRVTMSLTESLTNERMWFKSIEMPRTSVVWVGTNEYKEIPPKTHALSHEDKGFTNAVAPVLEKLYLEVMQTAWKYIDPEEMQIVKKQAQDIKERKVY